MNLWKFINLKENTCGFSRRMNPTTQNQSTFNGQSKISIHTIRWQAILVEYRNQARTERFCLVLRWRPARPKQSNNNRNQSMTGEPSEGSIGVDCWKQTRVYQYNELSPVAKEVFDKTRSAVGDSFTIVLCHEWTLTCDKYYESEIPDEFQYGIVGHNVDKSELYTVVEDEGEAYVLQTGALGPIAGWDLSGLPLVISSSLMVLLVSGVLVHNAIKPPEQIGNGFAVWDIGAALLVGTFALAVPYLHMWDILSIHWSGRLITGAVALGVPAYYFRLR